MRRLMVMGERCRENDFSWCRWRGRGRVGEFRACSCSCWCSALGTAADRRTPARARARTRLTPPGYHPSKSPTIIHPMIDATFTDLGVAALAGLAVGIEREWSGHAAGPQRALRRRAHLPPARPARWRGGVVRVARSRGRRRGAARGGRGAERRGVLPRGAAAGRNRATAPPKRPRSSCSRSARSPGWESARSRAAPPRWSCWR